MKLVIQRVKEARVSVDKEIVGQIKKGLFVLVGIQSGDSEKEASFLAEKLSKIRLMEDSSGKMNFSVKNVNAEMLVVSQFTLYADTTGGNRPSFIKAARPEIAEPLYKFFVEKLKSFGIPVQTGKFGHYMNINVELDGPVTIVIEQ